MSYRVLRCFPFVGMALFSLLFVLLFNPTISLESQAFYFTLLLGGGVGGGLFYLIGSFIKRDEFSPLLEGWSFAAMLAIGAAPAFAMFGLLALSFTPPATGQMAAALGEIKQSELRLPALDVKNAPLVPKELAIRKASAALSEIGSVSSQLSLGEMVKQEVNGKLVWVAFLERADFFKWLSLDSAPGYVVVSATDYSDVKVVTEIDGKPLSMKYGPGSYFGEDLRRHVWLNFSANSFFSQFTPEIDDSGRPFFVVPIARPLLGSQVFMTEGVLTVDAQTGEIKQYTADNAPAWVDLIESEDLVKTKINKAGHFVNGAFNWSGKDKFKVSSLDQVFSSDGKSLWVAGITNTSFETGVQRFLFIDTRSGEISEHKVQGVLESRAKQIVVDSHTKVYEPSNAIPFLVDGRPTYVMSLSLGDAIYAYGMVDIESETVFSSEQSLDDTFQAYLTAKSNSGLSVDENPQGEIVEGVVLRIGQDIKTGRYTLLLVNEPRSFVASGSLSTLLAVTEPGDRARMNVRNVDPLAASAVSFNNLSLEQR